MITQIQPHAIYSTKSIIDKAIHSLKGILLGITLDSEVNHKEIRELFLWAESFSHFKNRKPFNELISIIDLISRGELPSADSIEDIVWLTQKYEPNYYFYDSITSDIQVLHGLCHGILSDGVVKNSEITGLRDWLNNHSHLQGHYPYDELHSLILDVLSDGKIDETERIVLKAHLFSFSPVKDELLRQSLTSELANVPVSGICTSNASIIFEGRRFCLTGILKRFSRKEVQSYIAKLSGTSVNNINQETDYLIVGNSGNEAWAFSCYGRKVQQAIEMRKNKHKIQIIHEFDFCDKIEELI